MTTYNLPAKIDALVFQRYKTTIYYPSVIIPNPIVQQSINQKITETVQSLIRKQHYIPEQTEMLGNFEVKTNERGILSLNLSNYAYTPPQAHGMTYIQSITTNIETGKIYELKDLFKPNSDYITLISNKIRNQIKDRDLPTLSEFTTIAPNQDFYIADKSLVIYFQLYDITPYYVGLPMFPISIYELSDILLEDGPLGIMMPS